MQTHSTLTLPDGRALAYVASEGAEPGVVFLPGFKSDMGGAKAMHLEAWAKARGRAFLRFDYTGHGASSGAFDEGCIGDWLRDALDVFDARAGGMQVIVGSSMGGWIGLLLALRRPERVAGFVGIAPAPDFTEKLVWEAFPDAQRSQLLEEGRVLIPDCYGGAPYPITRRLVEEGRKHLLLDAPIAVSCPVRLLHGMQDADVPWRMSALLMEKLASPDVRLTLIKDGNHRLSRPEDLRLIAGAVEECA